MTFKGPFQLKPLYDSMIGVVGQFLESEINTRDQQIAAFMEKF